MLPDRYRTQDAMRAANQLPEDGLLLWIWPLYLHVNTNPMMMMTKEKKENMTLDNSLLISPDI